ncbi:MAG: hypothetical protein GF350_15495 [Chitinivibrionales bacterium]|nr:hypothetical protein [Chitinivibrionales bacterium]
MRLFGKRRPSCCGGWLMTLQLPVLPNCTHLYINHFLQGGSMRFFIALLFAVSCATAVTYYVSPGGDDSNDGFQGSPFKTLHHARDALRAISGEDKTVIIMEGNYFLDEPLRFDENDAGTEQHPVVWRGEDGKYPTIYGGSRITGWQHVEGEIYKAYVGSTDWEFWTLSENGKRCQPARHPNIMDANNMNDQRGNYRVLDGAYNGARRGNDIYYNEGDFPDTWDFSRARITSSPGWFTDTREISAVDFSSRCITMSPNWNPAGNYWVEGSKDIIDQPGEWALDGDGYVWYWPKTLPVDNQVIVGGKVLRIIEFMGSDTANPVKYITVEHVRLSTTDSPDTVYSSKTSPANPGDEDHENNCENDCMRHGIVQFENAEHCAIRYSKLWNAGAMGVVFNYYSQYNSMYGCWLEGVNYFGVYLGSYCITSGPWDYINHHNEVVNNYIHDYGKLSVGCAGVHFYQSGDNDVGYNEVRGCGRYGISSKGQRVAGIPALAGLDSVVLLARNNKIHHNDISHVIHSTADVGAYEQWNPGYGNQLYNCVFHDLYHIFCPSRHKEGGQDGFDCSLSYRNCVYHDAGFTTETWNIAAYNCMDVMNWWMEGGFGNMPYPFTRTEAKRLAANMGFDIDSVGVKEDFPWETPGQLHLDYELPQEMVSDPDLFDRLGPPYGDGTGLKAEYYSSSSLSGAPSDTTTEPYLGLNWSSSKNVRLTGSIIPLYTSTYRFDAQVRGTIKVWVDDQLLVDGSGSGSNYVVAGETISLEAGTPYSIKVEFTGGSACGVDWWCPEMPLHVIPQSQLYPVDPGNVGVEKSFDRMTPVTPSLVHTANAFVVHVPQGAGAHVIKLMRPDGSTVTLKKGAGKAVHSLSTDTRASGIYLISVETAKTKMVRKVMIHR